jgi:hypothetical protein
MVVVVCGDDDGDGDGDGEGVSSESAGLLGASRRSVFFLSSVKISTVVIGPG